MLGLGLAECALHLIAAGIEFGDLLRIAAHRLQRLQAAGQPPLDILQASVEGLHVAGLANDRLDLHQVVPVLQVAPQAKRGAEQLEALQLAAGPDEFAIGVADQIEVGQRHGNEEQKTDQAELHAEAQAIHECDCWIQQAFHTTSPRSYWYVLAAWGHSRVRQEDRADLYGISVGRCVT